LTFARLLATASLCVTTSVGCARIIGLTGDYYEGSDVGEASDAPRDEPAESLLPDGKLVFHRFTTYDTGDSEMFVVTTSTRVVSAELGQEYGVCNPLNGIWSPDGKSLVVMAQPRGAGPCGPTDRNQLDVYILDLEHPPEKQRVTMNTLPDEDPQFSRAGSFLVFKHNGHLAEWTLGSQPFTDCASLAAGSFCYNASSGEQSKPVITPDGKTICYYEAFDANADIYCFDRGMGQTGADIDTLRFPAVVHAGIFDGRPAIDDSYLYYVRSRAMDNPTRFIARKALDDLQGVGEDAQFCVDTGANYSEPCSVGNGVLVFSSTEAGAGGDDLFIADFSKRTMQSLDRLLPGVNTSKEEIGASFFRP
jgi:WD40-like Beta Propeller Repeat